MKNALALKHEFRSRVPDLVRASGIPSKVLAFDIGITERGVEKIKGGDSLPSLPVAIAMAQRIPALREYLVRLMNAELGESGEDPARVLDELTKMLAKHMNKQSEG